MKRNRAWKGPRIKSVSASPSVRLVAFLLLPSLLLPLPAGAASPQAPQSLTYQGQLLDQSGTAPLTGLVDFKFTIFNPGENCLLYEEVQNNVDLTPSNGMFSLQLGSSVGAAQRSNQDPGLSMAVIFANNGSQIRADDTGTTGTCVGGYSGAPGDARKLRVTVTSHMHRHDGRAVAR